MSILKTRILELAKNEDVISAVNSTEFSGSDSEYSDVNAFLCEVKSTLDTSDDDWFQDEDEDYGAVNEFCGISKIIISEVLNGKIKDF